MQIQDHPIVVIAGCIVGAMGVLSGIGGAWWYLEEDRLLQERWLEKDEEWNAQQIELLEAILDNQADLEQRLAINNRLLREVRATQHTIVGNQTQINYRLGKLIGKHDTFEESVGRLEELVGER